MKGGGEVSVTYMLVPQQMRCEMDADAWRTSWRQRECDNGWPVVGWLKEKRMTCGDGA